MRRNNYTPIIWIGKERLEYNKSFPTKRQALEVSERIAKRVIKRNKKINIKMRLGYNKY